MCFVPFGGTNVGYALGQMVAAHRGSLRPSCVFLDGDSAEAPGCNLLSGGDAPERVVFKTHCIAAELGWGNLWARIARDISVVDDACNSAMTLGDHHDWVRFAANQLLCGGDMLWRAMCADGQN